MKQGSKIIGAIVVCLITTAASAQERKEAQTELKEIKKEVRMEKVNGVNTLTISTAENGVSTEEVFTGAEADAKMNEMMPGMEATSETAPLESTEDTKEIIATKENGESKVTISNTVDGVETIEVYEGAEANKKMQELLEESGTELDGGEKKIIVKKRKEVRSEKVNE